MIDPPDPHGLPGGREGQLKVAQPSVVSSVSVIEQFFGCQLSWELINNIDRIPASHLEQLAVRLDDLSSDIAETLGYRRFAEQQWSLSPAGRLTMEYGYVAPHGLESYLDSTLALEDRMFYGSSRDAEAALSHVLLYCDRALFPDGTLAWAYEQMLDAWFTGTFQPEREHLRLCLSALMPFADAIRAGYLLVCPPPSMVVIGDRGPYMDGSLNENHVFTADPVVAAAVVRLSKVEAWEFDAKGIDTDDPDDLLFAAEFALERWGFNAIDRSASRNRIKRQILTHMWPGVAESEINHALITAAMIRLGYFLPVSSSTATVQHLVASAQQSSRIQTRVDVRSGDFAPAVTFRLPSLTHVTPRDLVSARSDEPLFAEVRASLREIAGEARRRSAEEDFATYSQVLASLARDQLRPLVEKIDKARNRTALTSLIAKGSGASLGFAIRALGTVHGLPVGRSGRLLGNAAGSLAGRSARKRQAALTTTRAVLYSFTGEPDTRTSRYPAAP